MRRRIMANRIWLVLGCCVALGGATHAWAQADPAPPDAPPGAPPGDGAPAAESANPQDTEEKAAATFDQLFGESVKHARATRDTADDVALANTLMDAARTISDQPNLLRIMLDTVYALSSRSLDGLDTAVAAMRLQADRDPKRADEARDRIILIYSRKFAAARTPDDKTKAARELADAMLGAAEASMADRDLDGALAMYRRALPVAARVDPALRDQTRATIDNLTQRIRVEEKVKVAKQRLQDNPEDKAAAAEIINLYVVELNDPVEARKYTFLTDEQNAAMIKLAAADPDTLDEAQYLTLGEWYRGKADAATGPAQAAMAARSQMYLQRYIRLHAPQDLAKTKAQLMLKQAEDRLARLGTTGPPPQTLATNSTIDAASLGGAFVARKIVPKNVPVRKGGKSDLLKAVSHAARNGDVDATKKLVADGAMLNPSSGDPPLWDVLREPRKETPAIVEALLAGGEDPNYADHNGYTLLHRACYYGDRDTRAAIVEALIRYGAKVNAVAGREKATPIGYAVERYDRNATAVLRANGATTDTPLHDAARVQDLVWAKEAIAAGADVNASARRLTPLGYAVQRAGPDALAMARFLIGAGAKVNPEVGRYDLTPVQTAAARGDRDTYDLLVKNGAVSPTPLHDAMGLGDPIMARKAIAAKLDPNTFDNDGHTPLTRLVSSRTPDPSMVDLLVKAGADPNKPDRYDRTPLYMAMTRGTPLIPVAIALIESGAAPDKPMRRNTFYPLSTTINNGGSWHQVALLLIEKGADVNRVDNGYPPLHGAIRRGETWLPVVKRLIEKGADLTVKDRRGQTPLECADFYHNDEATKLLRAAGAK
ncbi:MAG: hypothetical protein GC159_18360 [Phycisphaera sp.]|nr:hypothetical protein [Phycisphaera sp.]